MCLQLNIAVFDKYRFVVTIWVTIIDRFLSDNILIPIHEKYTYLHVTLTNIYVIIAHLTLYNPFDLAQMRDLNLSDGM